MCTVTYLPRKKGFILTSNRDEDKTRAKEVMFPEEMEFDEDVILFPKDKKGGGTWIACDNNSRVACLLNGAFEKHTHEEVYKKSRGLVVLDTFGYDKIPDFSKSYNFSGIEPFTLILIDYNRGNTELHEVRWDGKKVHHKKMNAQEPMIWSSATLYTNEVREEREQWFGKFLKEGKISMKAIRAFHQFGGTGDSLNDLVMERGTELSTVSISSIEVGEQGGEFVYQDLLRNETKRQFI
jgi:uncharacterized protein with NRDE domain